MKLRIIGDVHQYYDSYIPIAEEADYSIQVGDMGFNYDPLSQLASDCHKFIGGNHDNYDIYYNCHYSLESEYGSKDYGTVRHGGLRYFFIRGGFSIDWKQRTQFYLAKGYKSYWEQEELSMKEMYNCVDLYKEIQPDFVISHECPRSISSRVGDNEILSRFGYNPKTFSTRTSEMLEIMFQFHQPKQWVFGHYHKDWSDVVNGTKFTCLNELSYMDIDT